MKYRVLVKPEPVEEVTRGGIIIPDKVKDKAKYNVMKGVLVDVGSLAFTDPLWKEQPAIGATVLFNRHAGGMPIKGKDGEEYRLIDDEEIGAVYGC